MLVNISPVSVSPYLVRIRYALYCIHSLISLPLHTDDVDDGKDESEDRNETQGNAN